MTTTARRQALYNLMDAACDAATDHGFELGVIMSRKDDAVALTNEATGRTVTVTLVGEQRIVQPTYIAVVVGLLSERPTTKEI